MAATTRKKEEKRETTQPQPENAPAARDTTLSVLSKKGLTSLTNEEVVVESKPTVEISIMHILYCITFLCVYALSGYETKESSTHRSAEISKICL